MLFLPTNLPKSPVYLSKMPLMKNFICFIFLFFCQNLFGQRFEIGLRGGSGGSAYHNLFEKKKDFFGARPLFSQNYSTSLSFNFTKNFSVEYEFGYAKMGNGRYYLARELHYLQHQFSMRVNFLTAKKFWAQPYFRAGLYFSKLQKQKEYAYDSGGHAQIYLLEYSKVISTDNGFSAAIGASFQLRPHISLSTEIRFLRGSKNLLPEHITAKLYNMAAWGLVGFHFRL